MPVPLVEQRVPRRARITVVSVVGVVVGGSVVKDRRLFDRRGRYRLFDRRGRCRLFDRRLFDRRRHRRRRLLRRVLRRRMLRRLFRLRLLRLFQGGPKEGQR